MAFHLEGAVHELAGKAREAGSRALELDPNSAETHASLATLSYSYDHDWPSAQAGFERALELNPSYARAHLQYAMGLVTRGRFDAAVAHVRQARALDPLSYAIGNDLAVALYCAGRFDDAIAAARGTLEADRNYAPAHVIQGSSMAVKGDLAGALREDEQAIRKMGREPWILGRMGYALARAGRRADAERVAREIQATQGPAMQLALVYAGLGDKQRALDAMEQAARQRETDLNFMAVDPMLAALRGEARFVALKNSIGL
jgi:tetratricopeptide (TPR) repeat protein